MSMAKTATHSVELEPIDRLEDKIKRLVGLVDRMKSEQARQAEENQRLSRELEALRAENAQLREMATTAQAEAERRAPRRDLVPLHQSVSVFRQRKPF